MSTVKEKVDSEISRIAFRAPPNWKNSVELCFFLIGSNFKTSEITFEDTSFIALY